jgi:hypothetical protein
MSDRDTVTENGSRMPPIDTLVACSEIGTKSMTLKSAFEDVIGTTLAAISGVIAKLDYVSSLRSASRKSYAHWGLGRVYGESAADRALAEAHRLLFLKLLRTSLRALREDVEVSSGGEIPVDQYIANLRNNAPALLPEDLGGGSERHLNSVLLALSALPKSRHPSTPRV